MRRAILVVDDEKDTRDLMARALGSSYPVTAAADAEGAMRVLASDPSIVLMLSDVRMPGTGGLELLKAAKAAYPHLSCILLTAYGTVDQAVEAMKDGADDFIMKPVDLGQLEARVEKAMKAAALANEAASMRRELEGTGALGGIVGKSAAMEKVFRLVRQAAPTMATVLIQGPSGTGKELVARAIHDLSPRAKGPFVAVQCGALPETLLESELFGHERGAYTGAVARQIGRFEAANGGTIFLDEISEISQATQVKLLRALETRSFTRLGGTETVKADIRIVAATNRDLRKYVDEGKFREDLFYRLNVIDINLPPLCERPGDIRLLAEHFLREFSAASGGKVEGISPEAMSLLEAWHWPGNVRELRNAIEKMVVLSGGGMLGAADVPEEIRRPSSASPSSASSAPGTLLETEKAKILATLKEAGGNRTLAAKMLGISRRTIYRKLDEYAIQDGRK